MKLISPIKERALRSLAHFKYLTVSQSVKLNVGITKRVREAYAELAKQGYTNFVSYEKLHPTIGKVERVHFLTYRGVRLLLGHQKDIEPSSIRYPKNNVIFKNDYFHRVSNIDTHIAFEIWAKQHDFDVIKYETYFDKVGSQIRNTTKDPLKSCTRIDFGNGHFIDPDSIAIYRKNNKPQIFLIETYNGKDTKRVVEQLRKINYAVLEGLASDKYKINAPTNVFCTFQHHENMIAVQKRLVEDPYFQFEGIEKYYFFGLAEQIKNDFENSFTNLNGEKVKMSLV